MDEKITKAAYSLLQPLSGLEHARLEEMSKGHAVIAIDIMETMHNALGNVHGGFLFTLCDTAAGVVSASESKVSVTLNGDIHFIKGVHSGTLYTRADPIHCGKTTLVVDVKIMNEDDALIASGTFTMYILREL